MRMEGVIVGIIAQQLDRNGAQVYVKIGLEAACAVYPGRETPISKTQTL